MRYHVRRKDKEITDEEVMKRILKSTQYVTVAMSKGNEPYLVSFSHGYDEDRNCIYFHCASEGKKLDYLKTNNRIWGQAIIDEGYHQGECSHLYATVQFSGKVFFVDDPVEKWDAFALMTRQLDSDPERLMAGRDRDRVEKTIVGRIDIDFMTGKKSAEVTI